jgi:hypothetical protein
MVMAGVAYYEGESAVGANATHLLKGSRLEPHRAFVNAGVAVTSQSTVLTRATVGLEF